MRRLGLEDETDLLVRQLAFLEADDAITVAVGAVEHAAKSQQNTAGYASPSMRDRLERLLGDHLPARARYSAKSVVR